MFSYPTKRLACKQSMAILLSTRMAIDCLFNLSLIKEYELISALLVI
ncbi:hypothetical protein ADICYQ_4976 [Cyclobacterium qasimii M12-11B]|uniref:Uncharacterized protein n=1 Tax=Cyclobacterium qasimii M12-11B TaxID=641524 RepID=S7V8X5_9BACT|nr:hypothetical protein ADICYQ_4976 [Cyclobacterium qasimii M12-11B]